MIWVKTNYQIGFNSSLTTVGYCERQSAKLCLRIKALKENVVDLLLRKTCCSVFRCNKAAVELIKYCSSLCVDFPVVFCHE